MRKINASGTISQSRDGASFGWIGCPYFEIFRLNVKAKGEDIRYICKFDERKSFREAVTRLDVYYVVTEVKTTKSEIDVELEFLWVKEGNSWRILTIAAPEY